MTSSGVNAGGRLDRLPIARFHYSDFFPDRAGCSLTASRYSSPAAPRRPGSVGLVRSRPQCPFISATFVRHVARRVVRGPGRDRFGPQIPYQANLLIFGNQRAGRVRCAVDGLADAARLSWAWARCGNRCRLRGAE